MILIEKIIKNLILKRKRNLNITEEMQSKKLSDKINYVSKDNIEIYNECLIPIGSVIEIKNIDLNI
jgi:hypothetical protein